MVSATVVLFILAFVAVIWCVGLTVHLAELRDELAQKLPKGENPWEAEMDQLSTIVSELRRMGIDTLAEMRTGHRHLGFRVGETWRDDGEPIPTRKSVVMLLKKCAKCGGEHEEEAK